MVSHEPQTAKGAVWAARLGRGALGLAIVALLVAALGLTLARYDVIAKLPGFFALVIGGALASIALILAVVGLLMGRRHGFPARGAAIVGLAVSLLFVGFLASRPLAAGDAPAIHDVTTDLADPPTFETLPLRADNLVGVGTLDNWRRIHAQAYDDLRPVTIAKPVAVVTANALRLARESGWEIATAGATADATADATGGHIEATASVSYIRFRDDVVIRIVPIDGGTRSRVDMRSVSRIGVGDLGVNARRIRTFLAALATA